MRGSAFHDNDNNGVKIICSKPCFEADGTVFDTSIQNFHFKVPSGSFMVNGQKYQLAELDGNPGNSYELVIPEVQGKLGWSKNADGVFVYKRTADNNPNVMGGLTLYGKDLFDTTGIEGLRGEFFLNHPEAIHSFGVKGESNYNIFFVKDHGNLVETLFTNISPKLTGYEIGAGDAYIIPAGDTRSEPFCPTETLLKRRTRYELQIFERLMI